MNPKLETDLLKFLSKFVVLENAADITGNEMQRHLLVTTITEGDIKEGARLFREIHLYDNKKARTD